MNDSLRLFISVELSDGLEPHMRNIVSSGQQCNLSDIRWVRPELIHLTVKFLGNTDPIHISSILDAMKASTIGISPFSIQIESLELFSRIKTPRVLWLGIGGNLSPLIQIHERLESELGLKGFSYGRGNYSPHLTIGRIRNPLSPTLPKQINKISEYVDSLPKLTLEAMGLTLIHSKISHNGATYFQKGSIRLHESLA